MDRRIEAWECIGCGRIEAPQNCIGVCQDRKVQLIDARAFDALSHQLEEERAQSARLLTLVQRLAWSRPRSDAWERSYVALQAQARALLQELQAAEQARKTPAPVVRLDA
jgi:hypothetical protein